ncbi:MAG: ferredoxin reductase, partial [Burkholderiaceae bacterium]|nr:ferredoxin reductase [Burkholderiaceae bacterium]
MTNSLNALVHTLRYEAEATFSIELRPVDGGEFPAFEAGAHIDLHLPNGLVRSYSLLNDARERHRYVVAVLKDRASRGGSRYVHEQLRVGSVIKIGAPRNAFKLHEEAAHTVL